MELAQLKKLRTDMEKCFRCSLCKMAPLPAANNPSYTDACPAARLYHFHGYSGSGKQIMALSLLDGRIKADESVAKVVMACTLCGYCDVACKFIMDAERHRINMKLREHLVDAGLSPAPHRQAMENLKTHGYAGSKPSLGPGAWAKGLGLKTLPGDKADVLLFAGCVASDNEKYAATVKKLAKLMLHAGVDIGILGDKEACCGLPAYWMGYRDEYKNMAGRNADLIDSLGVKTVVTASGSCLGSFRSKYPEYARAAGVQILHATEFLEILLSSERIKLKEKVGRKVTYHDPCYLGRQSEPFIDWRGEEKIALGCMTYTDPPKPINFGTKGVFEPPRRILRAIPGLEFREMYRIREYSFCCGSGGGAPAAYPELARSAALHRIDEARDTGAECLVSACSHCETQFAGAQEGASDKLPVADIIDLVCESAGIGE